jgi:O-antigen/teichoic acid export membrane protein
MGAGNLIHAFLGIAGQITTMTGKINVNLYNSIVMSVVNVGLYLILIPSYGVIGAAVGNAISNLLINTLMCIEVFVIYGLHPFKLTLYKPVVAFLISVIFTKLIVSFIEWPMIPYSFVLHVVLFWGLYFIVLFRLKVEEEDYYVLERISAKLPSFMKKLVPTNPKIAGHR